MTTKVMFTFSEPEFKAVIQDAVKMALVDLEPKNQPKDNTPELLTRIETADYLGVSLPTLGNWTKRGIIKGLRIAGRVRYRKSDVSEALKEIETVKYRRA